MDGGAPGTPGLNTWVKQPRAEDGDLPEDAARAINIGGKATVWMGKGDRLRIETPGGGAWGASADAAGTETEQGQARARGSEWAARGSFAERAARQAEF
jgi:5-oxoprolinase (ATP-hydrolysing)